jgi:hypothetical protein
MPIAWKACHGPEACCCWQQHLTDPLAWWLVAARVLQSSVHLASLSVMAVNVRFTFFAVQMAIAAYWAWALVAQAVR